jgi:hypothetical protein
VQGAIGWWMVASGLSGEMVRVASYRLAVHLGLAFVILGFIAWYVFRLGRSETALMQARRAKEAKLFSMSTGLMHFAFLQILLGALVAGIDAGRSYVDWPLMHGVFFPPESFDLTPLWRNFFENPALVQFMHRMAGYLLLVFAIVVWLRGRKSAHSATRGAFAAVLGAMIFQAVLGVATVMHGAPWQLADPAPVHGGGAVGADPARAAFRAVSARHATQGPCMSAYDDLIAFTRETVALAQVAGRLGWDQETMMPRGASAQRSEEMAALEGVLHARRTDPRVGDWLEARRGAGRGRFGAAARNRRGSTGAM